MADLSGRMDGNATPSLTVSASFKGEGRSSSSSATALKRRASLKPNLETDELINLLHGSDPVKFELNRLENEVRGLNVVRSLASLLGFIFW